MKTKLLLVLPVVAAAILPSCMAPIAYDPFPGHLHRDTPSPRDPLYDPPFSTPPFCGTPSPHDEGRGSGGVCPGPILHPMPMPTLPGSIPPSRTRFPSPERMAPIVDREGIRRAVRPTPSSPMLSSAERMAPITDRNSIRHAVRSGPSSPMRSSAERMAPIVDHDGISRALRPIP
jgi:hypothetical protein